MWDISQWYCCLAYPERTVLAAVAAAFTATAPPFMPKAAFDALWLLFPYCGEARQLAFLKIYSLSIATIEGSEPETFIEAVVPDDYLTWILWLVFFTGSGPACLSGCEQSKPPYAWW